MHLDILVKISFAGTARGNSTMRCFQLIGLTAVILFGCAQTTVQSQEPPTIADRPFPRSLSSSQWCAAADEARNNPRINPTLRQRYIDAAAANGCYGPTPVRKQVYQKQGATNEEFQRTKAHCLMQAEIAESGSRDPNSWSRLGTWTVVFRSCMKGGFWCNNDDKEPKQTRSIAVGRTNNASPGSYCFPNRNWGLKWRPDSI